MEQKIENARIHLGNHGFPTYANIDNTYDIISQSGAFIRVTGEMLIMIAEQDIKLKSVKNVWIYNEQGDVYRVEAYEIEHHSTCLDVPILHCYVIMGQDAFETETEAINACISELVPQKDRFNVIIANLKSRLSNIQ